MSSCRSAACSRRRPLRRWRALLSRGRGARAALRLCRRRVRRELPLSYAQRRLWFLDRLEGAGCDLHDPAGGAADGRARRAALEGALDDLVARHESLRTVFPERGGVPRQEILPAAAARLELAVVAVERGGACRLRCRRRRGRGFDLAARAAAAGAAVMRLLATRARAAAGAASHRRRRLVARRRCGGTWRAFYRGAAARARRRRLPPLPVQYADYTLWQRAVLGDESDPDSALSRQLAYWTQRLAGLPEQLELPADRPRPAVSSHRGGQRAAGAAGGAARRACSACARQPARACSWCCRPRWRRC